MSGDTCVTSIFFYNKRTYKSNLRRGFIWLQVCSYSPCWWVRHRGQSLRQLLSLFLQAGSRER